MTLLGEGGQFDHNIVLAVQIIQFYQNLVKSDVLTLHQLCQPKITKFCPFNPIFIPTMVHWG